MLLCDLFEIWFLNTLCFSLRESWKNNSWMTTIIGKDNITLVVTTMSHLWCAIPKLKKLLLWIIWALKQRRNLFTKACQIICLFDDTLPFLCVLFHSTLLLVILLGIFMIHCCCGFTYLRTFFNYWVHVYTLW